MSDPIVSRPTPWQTVILVCGKCARRADGGYGPTRKSSLRKALKEELRSQGRRRTVRVIETKCFGLCPKQATVALNAAAPGQLLTVPRGTEISVVAERLLQPQD